MNFGFAIATILQPSRYHANGRCGTEFWNWHCSSFATATLPRQRWARYRITRYRHNSVFTMYRTGCQYWHKSNFSTWVNASNFFRSKGFVSMSSSCLSLATYSRSKSPLRCERNGNTHQCVFDEVNAWRKWW